jgi:hypothetical protein
VNNNAAANFLTPERKQSNSFCGQQGVIENWLDSSLGVETAEFGCTACLNRTAKLIILVSTLSETESDQRGRSDIYKYIVHGYRYVVNSMGMYGSERSWSLKCILSSPLLMSTEYDRARWLSCPLSQFRTNRTRPGRLFREDDVSLFSFEASANCTIKYNAWRHILSKRAPISSPYLQIMGFDERIGRL